MPISVLSVFALIATLMKSHVNVAPTFATPCGCLPLAPQFWRRQAHCAASTLTHDAQRCNPLVHHVFNNMWFASFYFHKCFCSLYHRSYCYTTWWFSMRTSYYAMVPFPRIFESHGTEKRKAENHRRPMLFYFLHDLYSWNRSISQGVLKRAVHFQICCMDR